MTVVVLVLLAVGAGRTVFSRMSKRAALEAGTAERAKQYVKTPSPKASGTGQTLALPGTLQGFVQAPIAARASGYLRRWYKDIGSRVEKGELLAEIETPEIDQQLSQARRRAPAGRLEPRRSRRAPSSAGKRCARRTPCRSRSSTSAAARDAQARANLAAADANVERLRQLEGFKRVVAPFAGVITRRNVDVGDLIDAGGGAGRALFLLAQTDPLRVYVNVPQSYAQLVEAGPAGRRHAGRAARRRPSRARWRARRRRSMRATRTMQVEITLPNSDGMLLPGALRAGRAAAAGEPGARRPDQRAAVPRRGHRASRSSTPTAACSCAGQDRPQLSARRSRCSTASRATDRLVLNPSDSLDRRRSGCQLRREQRRHDDA